MFFASLCKRGWDAIVHPTIRLNADFPWSFKKMGKSYLLATLFFYLGSFLPVLLFLGAVMLLGEYNPVLFVKLMSPFFKESGEPTVNFLVGLGAVSFGCGFGCELWYLRRCLHKDRLTLRGIMALNLDSLKGSWGGPLWAAIWRAALAYGIWYAAEHVLGLFLPSAEQDTAKLAQQLSGGNLVAFFLMAAVGAPILEEIVFRGFLFQALRSGLRNGFWARLLGNRAGLADLAAIVVSAACFSVAHLQFNPVTMLMLFLLGCLHAEVYRRSGSLIPSMFLHAINNGLAVLLLAMS